MAKRQGPATVRVVNSLKMDKFLVKLANDKSVNKAVQLKVFNVANENYRLEYAIAYKSLLAQIIRHLSNGFPGANASGVTFYAQNPFTGKFESITKDWAPLSKRYLARKAGVSEAASTKYKQAAAAEGKARKGKREIKARAGKAPLSSANKFWVFRRNLVASTSDLLEKAGARRMVEIDRKVVQKGGVLVSGRNRATIRFSVGLKFDKLKAPFDDMVRKPFMTGLEEKSRVWDSSPGSSAKKGFHAFAYVEAKRPFVVDLSASVGRMVRQRLKIT